MLHYLRPKMTKSQKNGFECLLGASFNYQKRISHSSHNRRTLITQIAELEKMTKRHLGIRILESDEDKKKVKEIFKRLDECAKDFHVRTCCSTLR